MGDARLAKNAVPIPWEDQEYWFLTPRDFRIEAAFSTWLEAEARRGYERHRADMDHEEYAAHRDGWRRDIACKIFSFGGQLATQALFSIPGCKRMAYEQFRAGSAWAKENGHPSPIVDEHVVDRMFEDADKVQEVMGLVLEVPDSKKTQEEAGPSSTLPLQKSQHG